VLFLTAAEEDDLDLKNEAREVKAQGMDFLSFPIEDRQVPSSEAGAAAVLEQLDTELSTGKNAVVHCRQGIGRTGLMAACLLVAKGFDPETAVKEVSSVRGLPIPETQEQRQWIDHYASILASVK
jgi:protein-tyrosine phosphatase